jgi:hypothetical protein
VATSNWNPGLTSSVASDNPNTTDTDGTDVNPGFTVSVIKPYRSPWSQLTDSDVWIPGTYKGNGFILTSLPYPIMDRDVYKVRYALTYGYTIANVVERYLQIGVTFLGGSLSGTLVTLPTQPTEQYRQTGVVFTAGGSLVVMVISTATQPAEQYQQTGITFTSGGSLVVMVVSLPTQPTEKYFQTGITFTGGSLT